MNGSSRPAVSLTAVASATVTPCVPIAFGEHRVDPERPEREHQQVVVATADAIDDDERVERRRRRRRGPG